MGAITILNVDTGKVDAHMTHLYDRLKHKLLCTFKSYAMNRINVVLTRRVVRHGKQQTWRSYYALNVRS